jgi:hypothetical protein
VTQQAKLLDTQDTNVKVEQLQESIAFVRGLPEDQRGDFEENLMVKIRDLLGL